MTVGPGVLALMAVGTYGARLLGLALAHRGLPDRYAVVLPLLPAALLAGLIVVNVTAVDERLAIDARAGGILVAIVLAARRFSMGAIVTGAVLVTAAIRAVGGLLG